MGFELLLSIDDLENLPFKERKKLIKYHPNLQVDYPSLSNLIWGLIYIILSIDLEVV